MSKLRSAGARRLVALASVTGMAAAGAVAVLAVGNGGAGADPVSKQLDYTCTYPLVGAQNVHLTVNTDIPKTIQAGVQIPLIQINGIARLSADTVDGLNTISAANIEGTADWYGNINSPDGNLPLHIIATVPKVATPASGTEDVHFTATAPKLTFSNTGHGVITIGSVNAAISDMIFHIKPTDPSGAVVPINLDPVQCKIDAGQNQTLWEFDVQGNGPTPTPGGPTPTPVVTPTPGGGTPTPTPVVTPTPVPVTPTPVGPTPTPGNPTPTPGPNPCVNTGTGTQVHIFYNLKGTTHINLANGDAPLTGTIDTCWNTTTKQHVGTLVLNPTVGQMSILGFLPVTVGLSFPQVGQTTGTLDGGVLKTDSNMYVKYAYFNVFGFFPIAGGDKCQTTTAMNVKLQSTQAVFQPLTGGPIAGGYTLPSLNDQCGGLGGIVAIFAQGGGNTINATLTPPGGVISTGVKK